MIFVIFSLLSLANPSVASAAQTGVIDGVVTTKAKPLPALRVTFDQAICGSEVPDTAVLVDDAGHLANVVVTVSGVKAVRPPRDGRVLNERCAFVPRVQVIAPGATVRTSSTDRVLHTTVVQQPNGRQLFNVALPAPGIELSKTVGTAGVLRVGCSTHQWMRGWLFVTDELSVVTGPDGRFRLPNLPAGSYELRFWHETLKVPPATVTVVPGRAATLSVDAR